MTDIQASRPPHPNYPDGSVGDHHAALDRVVDDLETEARLLARIGDVTALDQVGHVCQQLATRLGQIGVRANTACIAAERQATDR